MTYHLISRFVAKEFFISSDQQRADYLGMLGAALQFTAWRLLGYGIMSSHVHLVAVAGRDPLRDWIRRVHTPFADAVNRSRGRIGAVFVRGPKEIPVADAQTGRVLAYVHMNPVRAGVCERPRESDWTSHRAHLDLEEAPPWLDVQEVRRRLSGISGDAFDNLVMTSSGHPVIGDVTSDEHFDQLVDKYERERMVELRAQRTRPAVAAPALVRRVARELGVECTLLRSPRRDPVQVRGRGIVVACGVRLGCSTRDLADALGLTPQAIRMIARRGSLTSTERSIAERLICELSPLGVGG